MDKVKVRNNSRSSLLIKVPGDALRLQPGGTAEVPRAYLDTDELAALLRRGDAAVIASPAGLAVPAARAEADDDDVPTEPMDAAPKQPISEGAPRSPKKQR